MTQHDATQNNATQPNVTQHNDIQNYGCRHIGYLGTHSKTLIFYYVESIC
jgi:hypothetical protein